jgi:hypothetical protein
MSTTESTQALQRIRMAPGARSTEWPSYVSDDGTIHATLNYYATYSTQRYETGWHYQILVGSTIAVQ